MIMTLKQFTNRVVDAGIDAAREDYKNSPLKRDGAVAGFEACRDKNVVELLDALNAAAAAKHEAFKSDRERYWYYVCFHAEIEWVCNVVSAVLVNEGREPIITPTARGFTQAAKIIGIQGHDSLESFLEQQKN